MATLPQNNFVDISDGNVGFALINDSMMEYEVSNNSERVLAMTLIRAVRNWFCTETRVGTTFSMQKGSQCLGITQLRYAIRTHSGNWQDANIPLQAELFNVEQRIVQTRKHAGKLPAS